MSITASSVAIEWIEASSARQVEYVWETFRRVRKLAGCRRCPPSYEGIAAAIRILTMTGRLHEILPPEASVEWYLAFRQQLRYDGERVAGGDRPMPHPQPPGFDDSIVAAYRLAYLHGVYLHKRIARVAAVLQLAPAHADCRPTVKSVLRHVRKFRDRHRLALKRSRDESIEKMIT